MLGNCLIGGAPMLGNCFIDGTPKEELVAIEPIIQGDDYSGKSALQAIQEDRGQIENKEESERWRDERE